MRDTTNDPPHLDQYTTLKPLPRSCRSLERHARQHSSCTPPLSSLPPHFPCTTLCFTVSPKNAHFKAFWSLYALIWVQNGSARSRDMPPSTPPVLLTYQPSDHILADPPVLHYQSQNCPFQGWL